MFNLLKNLRELKEINDILSKEKITVERDGIKVSINGKMEVEDLVLNPNLEVVKQQKILRECLNDALRKMQMSLITKLSNKKFNI